MASRWNILFAGRMKSCCSYPSPATDSATYCTPGSTHQVNPIITIIVIAIVIVNIMVIRTIDIIFIDINIIVISIIREGFKKSKGKFKMAFAMKGGGS